MLETNANTAQNDIKNMGKDANGLLNETAATAADTTAEMRNKRMAMLDNTLSKAKEMQTVALENSKQLMRDTDEYVQKNPWRAISISAGIGLLLGFLFKRKY